MTKHGYRVLAVCFWVITLIWCLAGLWWWALLGVDGQAGAATIWTAILLASVAAGFSALGT